MIGNMYIVNFSACRLILPPFLHFRQLGEVDRYNLVF